MLLAEAAEEKTQKNEKEKKKPKVKLKHPKNCVFFTDKELQTHKNITKTMKCVFVKNHLK